MFSCAYIYKPVFSSLKILVTGFRTESRKGMQKNCSIWQKSISVFPGLRAGGWPKWDPKFLWRKVQDLSFETLSPRKRLWSPESELSRTKGWGIPVFSQAAWFCSWLCPSKFAVSWSHFWVAHLLRATLVSSFMAPAPLNSHSWTPPYTVLYWYNLLLFNAHN